MITITDCIGLCDVKEEEVEAIAQHEHIPMIVAIEMAEQLIHEKDGAARIRQIIVDDLCHAEEVGHHDEVQHWKRVLLHFDERCVV